MVSTDGWCVWITGLPGSGKSIVANALREKLQRHNIKAQILSSDALRKAVTPEPTYTEEERDIFYSALVLVAQHLTENGINIIIDATGNRRRYRQTARTSSSQRHLQASNQRRGTNSSRNRRTLRSAVTSRSNPRFREAEPGRMRPSHLPKNSENLLDPLICRLRHQMALLDNVKRKGFLPRTCPGVGIGTCILPFCEKDLLCVLRSIKTETAAERRLSSRIIL